MRSETRRRHSSPTEVSPDWDSCSAGARGALDKIFNVGPGTDEPVYRFGIFNGGEKITSILTNFATFGLAEVLSGDGEHVRRGRVIGHDSAGHIQIEWEAEPWMG